MKEHIYTIPLIDGFQANSGCPFCFMREKLEEDAVNYTMGSSYMEEDIRAETDSAGFCGLHAKKMLARQNRLGLALMLHTHFKKVNRDISGLSPDLPIPSKRFLKKGENRDSALVRYLNRVNQSCYICDRIETVFARYVDTFFYLWKTDPQIIPLIKNNPGFCLTHFTMLLEQAQTALSKEKYQTFARLVVPLQMEFLTTVEEDLAWFINKFDYRCQNEPWKNAKDALPRAVKAVTSAALSGEETKRWTKPFRTCRLNKSFITFGIIIPCPPW